MIMLTKNPYGVFKMPVFDPAVQDLGPDDNQAKTIGR
jgi:hypothetical protein